MTGQTVVIAIAATLGVPAGLVLYSWLADQLVKRLRSRTAQNRLRPVLWLLPAAFLLIVWLLYPLISTTVFSFKGPQSDAWVGLRNFQFVFTNGDMLIALRNNLIWVVVFTTFTVGVGLLMAVLTDRVKYESVAKSILFMPMAISYVAAGVIWRFMYQYQPAGEVQTGTLNALLTSIVPNFEPSAWHFSRPPFNTLALIAVAVWIWTGFCMVILSASLKGVDQNLIDSGRIDGCTEWQVFWRIIVPIISSTIVVVVTTMIINVLKMFDIVYVMTNGRLETEVIANRMYKEMFVTQDYGHASAIAVVLFLAVVPVIILNIRKFVSGEEA
ncbi:MAG TPA: sugar ABC transporter permease [Spirochaetia bacterium]|nr:sugar ABC transporter permease [Spirochaetia bacterium]